MPHRHLRRIYLLLACLSIAITAQALDFKSGEWQLVVRQSIKGMPTGMGAMQWRECLTQDHPIPTLYLQASNCEVLETHVVYHTVRYKLSCYTDHGTVTNEGSIHYGNFRINGKSKSEMGQVAGENTVVRYKFEGRRIGDCH